MRLVGLAIVLAMPTIAPASAQVPANASSPGLAPQKAFSECVKEPERYLVLSFNDFDQGVQPVADGPRRESGWREIAQDEECYTAVAMLISQWRERNAASLSPRQQSFIAFHEGQLRAGGGDHAGALPLIEAGRHAFSGAVGEPYVDATLAFLRSDREALIAARERLLAVPEPANWPETQRALKEQAGQDMKWPLNIEATDRLIRCFGKAYPVYGKC